MASNWDLKITYVDSFGEKTTITHFLGEFTDADFGAEALAAQSAGEQIVDAYDAMTNAFKSSVRLQSREFDDNQIPSGGVLISSEARVNTHLNAPTELQELWTLRIPAPVSGMFLTDGKTVDPTDSDLIALVGELSDHALVSDGESINTSTGSNGIASPAGYLVTKRRKYD